MPRMISEQEKFAKRRKAALSKASRVKAANSAADELIRTSLSQLNPSLLRKLQRLNML